MVAWDFWLVWALKAKDKKYYRSKFLFLINSYQLFNGKKQSVREASS